MSGGARAMSEEELVTEPSQSPRNDKQATDRGQPDYFTVMKGQLADPSYKTCTDPISAATPGERYSDVSQPDMSPPPGSWTSCQDLRDPRLSKSEVESFGDEVDKLDDAVKQFPRALGLFVSFSNSRGCDGAVEVPNIHRSSDKMCAVYGELGFAHCSFKDSPRAEIAAVFKELSAMSLPKSYKSVIIYYAGHGKDWCLNVEDSYLAISDLIEILSKTGENQLKNVAKVIVFDCCRTTSGLAPPQFPIPQDTMVVYSTALGQKTFIVDDRGLTVVGIELVKLLEREQSCHLTDLFQVGLNKALNEKNETSHLVNWQGCLLSNPDLYMEKLRAMAPREVQLTEDSATDRCVLSWSEPLHASLQGLEGYSIAGYNTSPPFNLCPTSHSPTFPRSTHTPSHLQRTWEVLRERPATETSLEFSREDVCSKELTVVAHYSQGRKVNAAEVDMCPEVHLKSVNLWCRLRQRWNLMCCAFSTILLFIVLIGLSYIVVDRSFVHTLPKHNILAVAGDVIDCSGLDDSWHKVFYSSVSITQVATDVVNDNPLGLSMEIASLDRRDLKFHPRNLSGTFEDTLSNKTNVFVIPEGIFQHPVYMWAGSNVTIDVMMNYLVWPKELTAYVILGDQNLNSFFSNPWVTPKHEYKFSLLENTHQTYHYTFRKNGYFFIAVRIQTDEESNFTANVQFDYSAIIKQDYNFKHGQTLATVKSTLSEALDIRDQELVVCVIDDHPDSYSHFTIHLDLAYGLRKSIVYILPLVLVPILVLVLMSLFAKYLFSRCQSRAHSQSQYHRLNGVNS